MSESPSDKEQPRSQYSKLRARLSLQVAETLVCIAQNSKNRSKVEDEELLLRVLTEGDEQR
jgi:hypothetical protein